MIADEMNPDHLYELAVRFYRGQDYDNAYTLANHLRLIDPMSYKTYKILGIVQQAKENYSFAVGAYQRAILLNAMDTETMYYMAQCYTHLQDYGKAAAWLQAFLAISPDDASAKRLHEVIKKKLI